MKCNFTNIKIKNQPTATRFNFWPLLNVYLLNSVAFSLLTSSGRLAPLRYFFLFRHCVGHLTCRSFSPPLSVQAPRGPPHVTLFSSTKDPTTAPCRRPATNSGKLFLQMRRNPSGIKGISSQNDGNFHPGECLATVQLHENSIC